MPKWQLLNFLGQLGPSKGPEKETHHVHDVLIGAGLGQDGVELVDAARGAL